MLTGNENRYEIAVFACYLEFRNFVFIFKVHLEFRIPFIQQADCSSSERLLPSWATKEKSFLRLP